MIRKQYIPWMLTIIFLGYAPFLGESFRIYFQNFSGFISLAILLAILYWHRFQHFILEKNSIQSWWVFIMLYCIVITLPHFGKYSLYEIYLDLGVFFVMLFGFFFGNKIASKICLVQLIFVMTFILILLSGKILWMWLNHVPGLPDGIGFFIGSVSYGPIPKIVLRGEIPFLTSILVLLIGVLLLRKNTAGETIGLTLVFLLITLAIIISGVRSIYFAILPSCIFLGCFLSKKGLRTSAYVGILLGIFFISLHLFVGRDALSPNPADTLKAAPGMEILASNGWGFLSAGVIQKMASGHIPALNSMSVALKMAEYLEVIRCVNNHWPIGLGMGATCFSPATQSLGNYVHSQPFWLFLKGGLLLIILFYSLIGHILFKGIRFLRAHPQNFELIINLAVLIALCMIDVLTNQFPTLAGSFYLGFWLGLSDAKTRESVSI